MSAVAPAQASTLPPRAEDAVIRNADGDNDEDNDDDSADGAYIQLRVQPDLGGAWTVVQWQDGMGRWNDVDGWRAQVGPDQAVNWWVAPKDLDTGPYRWLVYQDQDRRGVVWASQPFYLPKRGETLVVTTAASMRPANDRPDFRPMMPYEPGPHDSAMMPEGQPHPKLHMPEKPSGPDSLMPETGSSLGGLSRLITTVFSAIAALALVAGGLVAAFRNGFTI